MQTILSLAVQPEVLAARPADGVWHKVTRHAYSIDGYSPVLVTIRIGNTTATVQTTCLPGRTNGWWREPDATTRRTLVDEALAGTGRVRTDRTYNLSADEWHHTYPITPARHPAPKVS